MVAANLNVLTHLVWATAFCLGLAVLAPSQVSSARLTTAPTCAGTVRNVDNVKQLKQAAEDLRQGRLRPGSVIRLSPNTYRLDQAGPPLSFKNIPGTSEDCPITLEGAGAATIIHGERSPMSKYYRESFGPTIDLKTMDLLDQRLYATDQDTNGLQRDDLINCVRVEGAAWLVIRSLSFTGCWPSAVLLRDAQYVTVQDVSITGATYAIVAYGSTHHVLLEDSNWTQDPSGDVWSRIPWAVSHHGSRSFLNGALFGGKDIKGSIVIRRNHVRYAYNGIRAKGSCGGQRLCDQNMNVEIYDNTFEFIRDNPVEPEHMAANWWVHHNKMKNVHAAFSFDGARGGPHYVFGNVGWFTEAPENHCIGADWADDRDTDGILTEERECRKHRSGKTFKLGNALKKPLYIFHNSWLLRSPIVGGGTSGPIRAWNNAVEFCDKAKYGNTCVGSAYVPRSNAADRFIWKLSETGTDAAAHEMRFNISNDPNYPARVRAVRRSVAGMHVSDVGFRDGRAGDFRLRPNSPARNAGCIIRWQSAEDLTCERHAGAVGPDIGAFQDDMPVKGPVFRHTDGQNGPDGAYVERPRVVDVDFDGAQAKRFSIFFSVPIRLDSDSANVILRLKDQGASLSVSCVIDTDMAAKLDCASKSHEIAQKRVAAILLPRNIRRRDGRRALMTLWAKSDPRLGFVD